MFSIQTGPLPTDAFLHEVSSGPEIYADCFYADLSRTVTLPQYIRAFFDSAVFRMERVILTYFLSSPSSKADVQALACGTGTRLAAWQVTKRGETQILLSIPSGPVRTWLMVQDLGADAPRSRIYFGTALVPKTDESGAPQLSASYRHFTGLHRFYSKLLLSQALHRLGKMPDLAHSSS